MHRRGRRVGMRADLYQRITIRIVQELERGVQPWFNPWMGAHVQGRITRPMRFNGTPYCGINVLSLWAEAVHRGFCAPTWLTFMQAKEAGGRVRKGETESIVVYSSTTSRPEQT